MGNKSKLPGSKLPGICSAQVELVKSLPIVLTVFAFLRLRISVINAVTLIVFLPVVS